MNHLFLVRHGENLANLTKEMSCRRVDYSLTPKGSCRPSRRRAFPRGG